MTSLSSVRNKIEKLTNQLGELNRKTAFAWLGKDGCIYPHRNDFSKDHNLRYTPEEYEAKMKAEGYTDIIFITWGWNREKLQKPDGSNDDSENVDSMQFLPGGPSHED